MRIRSQLSHTLSLSSNKVKKVRKYATSEQRLKFLEQKKILANTDELIRNRTFELLNNPSLASTEVDITHYQKCQERVDRLLDPSGDMTAEDIPKDVQTFESFCEKIPQWNDPRESYVFFRDDPRVAGKNVLSQRAQLSGLCYIHGPDVLQHYLVSMNTKEPAGMVDIAKMIQDSFSPKQLEAHIFNDEGGSSEVMLRHILEEGSDLKSSSDNCETIMRAYGPMLVSRFQVNQDFYGESYSYTGIPKGNYIGYHAMLLVGTRQEKERKYLLQNWWKSKQFVEVSEEYLSKSKPTLYYVTTPQYTIPSQFPTYYYKYAENENVDKPESCPLEGPLKGIYN